MFPFLQHDHVGILCLVLTYMRPTCCGTADSSQVRENPATGALFELPNTGNTRLSLRIPLAPGAKQGDIGIFFLLRRYCTSEGVPCSRNQKEAMLCKPSLFSIYWCFSRRNELCGPGEGKRMLLFTRQPGCHSRGYKGPSQVVSLCHVGARGKQVPIRRHGALPPGGIDSPAVLVVLVGGETEARRILEGLMM